MKFCSKCGQEVNPSAVVCVHCGCSISGGNGEDSGSFGYSLLGFCIPIIGLILFLVWKDSKPLSAKAAGKGALVSVILAVILYVVYFVIIVGFLATSEFSALTSLVPLLG